MFKIGVIGCGNMGEAIIRGLTKSKTVKSTDIIVSDIDPDKVELMVEKYNVAGTSSNRRVVENSEIIFLAVKPKDFLKTVEPIKDFFTEEKVVISVIAGISIQKIKEVIKSIVIRVMPNTPALIGEGAIAVSFEDIDPIKREEIFHLLKSLGSVVEVDESLMDTVTGLSGSGPAYVFMFIEGLIQGGIKGGLSYKQASELAVQTVLGAAKLVKETGEHPSVLRDKVSSPAGTTIYALHKLEEKGLKDAVISAVEEATKRSKKLSQ
ncbi:pyrroline-5-carboxylate reductase [Persephonella hydrogeniphila]|uniref:Pyrroline-5-carboxylate reductase n=1 Tax=Persephonella hydrogeniphila TaxID=198703 RepID=A0A285NMJ5_9AQUI|nr:pyrroline-5-carboxylate reductase [Persephonella hydrogeniphila]SNZ10153.1 pyrroline-5-carboxylate reductase [Persephonella hydrogeniphila]